MSILQKVIALAVAGALGTLARYGLCGLVSKYNGTGFPWGTLAVNLTGCFLAGLLWALFEHRWPMSTEMKLLVLVGFMGAFTTFSAFILETGHLVRSASWTHAAVNVAIQNTLGLVALFSGAALGRMP